MHAHDSITCVPCTKRLQLADAKATQVQAQSEPALTQGLGLAPKQDSACWNWHLLAGHHSRSTLLGCSQKHSTHHYTRNDNGFCTSTMAAPLQCSKPMPESMCYAIDSAKLRSMGQHAPVFLLQLQWRQACKPHSAKHEWHGTRHATPA